MEEQKTFNIAGACIPSKHYMVNIDGRLSAIRKMVDQGNYFCINRGRQYGKTTTLNALVGYLSNQYMVFQVSFEGLDDSIYSTQESLMRALLRLMRLRIQRQQAGLYNPTTEKLLDHAIAQQKLDAIDFMNVINELCTQNANGVVLLIDEVDQAGNYETFIKLLGVLRNLYLDRANAATFQSVILAGVYDVKNLRLKIRHDGEHQYNSPWNIAVPFSLDMSLHADGIADMLCEYEVYHHTGMDTQAIAEDIYSYTSGYPFLVSRLCMLMDESGSWTRQGVLDATKILLTESNTLFDDMNKKLSQFPELKRLMYQIIFEGRDISFNADNPAIEIAQMFSFVENNNGRMQISNRLFETRLYNLFISESKDEDDIYDEGVKDKSQFIQGGQLNMPLILERFCHTYTKLYKDRTEKFDEDEGRKKFIFFMKPIINGIGNYYVEARTRGLRRTDLVIDYLGHQYIIEMKIWHGNAYQEKGEIQLEDYLRANDKAEGYMLTFCFNKQPHTPAVASHQADKRTILEYFV